LTLTCLVILRLRERAAQVHPIPIARRLAEAAIPLAMADDLKAGISTAENLMVPKRLSLYTAGSLALFGTVCGMVFPILMFPAAILFGLTELLIPEMARCNAAGSKGRIHYLMKRSLRLTLLYGTLCSGILFLAAPELCSGLYRNEAAGQYLRWFAPLAVMLYCDIITDAMIKGLGQQKISVRYNILTSAMDVALLFILLPKYGIKGYFFSFLVTHAINFLLSLRRLMKITNQGLNLRRALLTLGCGALSVWPCASISDPILRCISFGAILNSALVLLGVLRKEDLRWLKGLVYRK
jgi:stage V sporulation protein B